MLKGIAETGASLATIIALLFSVITYKNTVDREERIEIEKSKPYLQLTFAKVNSEADKGFIISNVGQGAAQITSFKYYINEDAYQKKEYQENWAEDNVLLFTSDQGLSIDELNILTEGRIIPNGYDNRFFLVRETEEHFYNRQLRKDMDNVIIEIEYKSLNGLDDEIYYLRFCENYKKNHVRDRDEKAVYQE